MTTIDSISVSEAMSPVEFTVSQWEKLDGVAQMFQQRGINSAPVVDEFGKCVGIITSGDLVRFQSELAEIDTRINHGLSFEVTQSPASGSLEIVEHPFDEVKRQMTSCLQTIDQSSSILLASKIMCDQNIHHLIVLDQSQRPVGILSSLDILAKLNR